MRGRGSKQHAGPMRRSTKDASGSPSVRGRGSKPSSLRRRCPRCARSSPSVRGRGSKRRFHGLPGAARVARSPSVRGRGSKRRKHSNAGHSPHDESPSVRGRGSKRFGAHPDRHSSVWMSPSVRGRGSKLANSTMGKYCHHQVALRAGAWIETGGSRKRTTRPHIIGVALRAGAWIETLRTAHCPGSGRACRPPCGGVDRNFGRGCPERWTRACWSPSVRGRGSKHLVKLPRLSANAASPSVRGRGSKPLRRHGHRHGLPGRPPCGGVDRNAELLGDRC